MFRSFNNRPPPALVVALLPLFVAVLAALAPAAHAANRFVLDTQAQSPAGAAVDGAGTGYFAWVHVDDQTGNHFARYCRVPSGSTCAGAVTLPPVTAFTYSVNTAYPLVAPNRTVYVLGTGFAPGLQGRQVVMWTSTDGGRTFGAPTNLSAGKLTYGCCTGEALLQGSNVLATIDEPGAAFASLPLAGGADHAAAVSDARGDNHSGLALDPLGRPAMAWMNTAANPYSVRWSRFKGTGDANSADNWTRPAEVAKGADPSLAGGPSGVFLASEDYPARSSGLPADEIHVRKLGASGFSKPVTLDVEPNVVNHGGLQAGVGDHGRIFQVPSSGKLLVAWRDGTICPGHPCTREREAIRLFSSTDHGASFDDDGVIAYDDQLDTIRLATNAAGQGFATFRGKSGSQTRLEVADLRPTGAHAKGAVSGRIVNLGRRPVTGLAAEVAACLADHADTCRTVQESQAGGFKFDRLIPGIYSIQAYTREGGFSVTRDVAVEPGKTTKVQLDVCQQAMSKARLFFAADRDVSKICTTGLGEVPLAGAFSVETPEGPIERGVPAVFNTEPFSLRIPLQIPAQTTPNATRIFAAVGMINGKSAPHFANGAEIHLAGVVMFTIHYGANGLPETISDIVTGEGVPQHDAAGKSELRAAATNPCRWGTTTPGPHGGVVLNFDGVHLPFPPVQLPPPPPSGDPTTDAKLLWGATSLNMLLNVAPVSGEYNTAVNALNVANRLPDVRTRADARALVKDATVNVVMPKLAGKFGNAFDGSGAATVANLTGNFHGSVPSIHPDPCDNGISSATIYVDPSGRVTSHGVPVAGAKVVLTRAGKRRGRQVRVRHGSPIMSPSNRRNPDRTDAIGRFGWDVLPGFYRVTVSKRGCRATKGHGKHARTRVFAIPPAVTSASLRLNCSLHRRASHVDLRVVRAGMMKRGTAYLLRAEVRGHGKLVGTVTFSDGRHVLVQVTVHDGRAAAPVLLRGAAHRFRASYSGNAFLAPSNSRPVRR